MSAVNNKSTFESVDTDLEYGGVGGGGGALGGQGGQGTSPRLYAGSSSNAGSGAGLAAAEHDGVVGGVWQPGSNPSSVLQESAERRLRRVSGLKAVLEREAVQFPWGLILPMFALWLVFIGM